MKDIDLTKYIIARSKSYPRKRGRYSASEVFAILKGWTKPEDFLKPKQFDIESMLKMWRGNVAHDHIQKLLEKEGVAEEKREVRYKDIVLVGKADFLPNDASEVWEFKTSDVAMPKSKEWHDHQARLYTTMFARDKAIVLQPLQTKETLYLKALSEVTRDDDWFKEQMKKLYEFHLAVEPFWNV